MDIKLLSAIGLPWKMFTFNSQSLPGPAQPAALERGSPSGQLGDVQQLPPVAPGTNSSGDDRAANVPF